MKERNLIITIAFYLMTTPEVSMAADNAKEKIEALHQHQHHEVDEEIDHNDQKNQHRMGIFHYNEGNRFLRKGEWLEAQRNYKMALHHDKMIYQAYINLSTAYLQGKKYPKALKILKQLQSIQPQNPVLHYNFACYHSLTSHTTLALKALKKATQLGFKDKRQIENDPDLENLRKTIGFLDWWASL